MKALLLDADPCTRWMGGLISGDPLPEDAPTETSADLPPAEVTTEHVG